MTLQQIAFFTAVHRNQSFTAAAKELGIPQSTLSKQIFSLEKELGIELFNRTTRRTQLSEAGRRLLPCAAQMEEGYNQILACAAKHQENSTQKETLIRLGGVPVVSIYGITDAILKFESVYPCSVEMRETKTSDILHMLSENQLDIGIVRLLLPLEHSSDSLRVYPLIDDQQVLVTARTHRLAQDIVGLHEAEEETFVQMNSDPLVAAYHLQLIESAVPNAKILLQNIKMDSIMQCILQKGWISLMMR